MVYYGHGYRIVSPRPQGRLRGHNLASSHVGFEFKGGMSLLQATDVPPTTSVSPMPVSTGCILSGGTLTLMPGEAGAMVRHPLPTLASGRRRRAAAGGRFCFDIWEASTTVS